MGILWLIIKAPVLEDSVQLSCGSKPESAFRLECRFFTVFVEGAFLRASAGEVGQSLSSRTEGKLRRRALAQQILACCLYVSTESPTREMLELAHVVYKHSQVLPQGFRMANAVFKQIHALIVVDE